MQQHQLTVAEIAKLYGKARSTIHRALKAGRLSATVRGDGVRIIALSECIRVWGEPRNRPQDAQHDATPSFDLTQQAATEEIFSAMLDELKALRAEVSDLKQHMKRLPSPLQDEPRVQLKTTPLDSVADHPFSNEIAALKAKQFEK